VATARMAQLNFDAHNTLYATHGLHAFAAKCPPQLVKYGISRYSKRGETVLDPMMGSGTTLVEARLLGRNAVGYDIDPLARLIARVKSRLVSDKSIETACDQVVKRARADLDALRCGSPTARLRKRASPPDFPRRDFWFEARVSEELALLSYHISRVLASGAVRDFLWVAFSSLILSRTSVANARDIVHSRPHYWKHSEIPTVIPRFEVRIQRMRKQATQFREMYATEHHTRISARIGDARGLRLRKYQ